MARFKRIRALLQPDQTDLCGQTCVAMVAGVSIDEAVRAVGHCKATGDSCLLRGLRELGVKVGDMKLGPKKGKDPTLPRFALATVADNRTQWAHAVVLWDGQVYDPGIGIGLPLRVYEDYIIDRAYSRRYKKPRDGQKRVKAKWESFIVIEDAPTMPKTTGSATVG